MSIKALNPERNSALAQLESTIGMRIVRPSASVNCELCQARKICDQVTQEESESVQPGSKICNLAQGKIC